MRRLDLALSLGVVATIGGLAGCGDAFMTTTGSGGNGGGTASTSTSTTDAASTGSAGSTGATTSSTGGGSCTPGSLKDCQAGSYCRSDGSVCSPCADLGRFQFGTPQPLDVSGQLPGSNSYPRLSLNGDLYYLNTLAMIPHIYTASYDLAKKRWNIPSAVPLPVFQATGTDNAPIFLTDASALESLISGPSGTLSSGALLFDSNRTGSRMVYLNVPGSMLLPSLKLPGGGSFNAQIAAAPEAAKPRLWWISNAVDPQGLVTALPGDSMPAKAPVPGPTCHLRVAAPWVTRDGGMLLFHAPDPDGNCTVQSDASNRLYYVPLSNQGQPVGMAARILPTSPTYDSTPALSSDRCVMVFTKTDVGAKDGALYGAVRE